MQAGTEHLILNSSHKPVAVEYLCNLNPHIFMFHDFNMSESDWDSTAGTELYLYLVSPKAKLSIYYFM